MTVREAANVLLDMPLWKFVIAALLITFLTTFISGCLGAAFEELQKAKKETNDKP